MHNLDDTFIAWISWEIHMSNPNSWILLKNNKLFILCAGNSDFASLNPVSEFPKKFEPSLCTISV